MTTLKEIREVLKENIPSITPWSIACQLNYNDDKKLFSTLGLTKNSTLTERAEAIKRRCLNV